MPFFYNYGVNTVILRNRLRRDGYNAQTDAVMTRSRRCAWSAPMQRSCDRSE